MIEIFGLRTNNSLDFANQLFGSPITTSDGVENTTRYNYEYEGGQNATSIILSADSTSNKIDYIEVTLK
jgi:hypothetical protein